MKAQEGEVESYPTNDSNADGVRRPRTPQMLRSGFNRSLMARDRLFRAGMKLRDGVESLRYVIGDFAITARSWSDEASVKR